MRRRLTLLAVAVASAALAPFALPSSPAQAAQCNNELDVACLVGSIACRADDSLYEKSAVYRETGGIDCLH